MSIRRSLNGRLIGELYRLILARLACAQRSRRRCPSRCRRVGGFRFLHAAALDFCEFAGGRVFPRCCNIGGVGFMGVDSHCPFVAQVGIRRVLLCECDGGQ